MIGILWPLPLPMLIFVQRFQPTCSVCSILDRTNHYLFLLRRLSKARPHGILRPVPMYLHNEPKARNQ